MGEQNRTDHQARKGETIADLLDEDTGTTQGRRSDILSDVVVNGTGDDLDQSRRNRKLTRYAIVMNVCEAITLEVKSFGSRISLTKLKKLGVPVVSENTPSHSPA